MPQKIIRVGSRESPLAVIQARIVMDAIRKTDPALDVRLVTMKTTGDRLANAKLSLFGGKGLFVKELDRALLTGEVDLTVHSYKDMPMDTDPALPVVAVSERADPRDVLVLPAHADAAVPTTSLAWGCSSARRACQLQALFPGIQIEPVRGNVQTRLAKLDGGGYASLVLAAAGLLRAGLKNRISRYFSTREILPAACQGILAVQARQGTDLSFLRTFHAPDAWDAAVAERAFVRALGGGCGTPVAAFAVVDGGALRLEGLFLHEQTGELWRGTRTGPRADAADIGTSLAETAQRETQ
ncbi:MAG: hydroxymethylbilane synthase [Ethanoligenens sp.]